MADSRQFKSTDTSKWTEKFGNKSDGDASINTSTFAEANETFTGSSGATTGTAGGTSIATNDCVVIHQTQGSGAGSWELNKVTSGGSTSLTFKYALCNSYGAGAQILKLRQYSSLTINTSQTLTGSSWNGSKGGIVAYLVNGIAQGPGTISVAGGNGSSFTGAGAGGAGTGRGFSGGNGHQGQLPGGQSINGNCGNSIIGNDLKDSNGGGGGHTTDGDDHLVSGGGGGNGGAGATGTSGTGDSHIDGPGGIAVGNAALTLMDLGGGGGGGADSWNDPQNHNCSGGGSGGGIVLIIAKEIKDTLVIQATGGNGGSADAPGGGGAGGSILLKGKIVSLGGGLVTAAGGAVGTGGGAGGAGRIHVDYSVSLDGTTTPTLDSTQDTSIVEDAGGFFNLNFQ
jgi:hypothetical protein